MPKDISQLSKRKRELNRKGMYSIVVGFTYPIYIVLFDCYYSVESLPQDNYQLTFWTKYLWCCFHAQKQTFHINFIFSYFVSNERRWSKDTSFIVLFINKQYNMHKLHSSVRQTSWNRSYRQIVKDINKPIIHRSDCAF